ncbi:hypothetical protein G3N55_06825 [Dissulfurirhabdus thermomarina]|uniref:Uncharacterized protein n=1 Tax=Dissulfurirhabdus thermomarina TaxID=1765737 RepID=A0A6N9TS24_DISTH|nr:hypothetical protein [Dissulfurirhabdus thermomarina]NDY42554.1 hypothetical protein [Dissulfurirhabdus thermomarina]NMX23687.1 hypothetical protein [Dissulfurirhabdus thermomarina]
MRRRLPVLCLGLCLSLAWAGAAGAAPEGPAGASPAEERADPPAILNLSPLFYRLSWPGRDFSETEAVGPVFLHYSGPGAGTSGWALRPLCSYSRTPGKRVFEFLYPLGNWQETENGRRWRFIPLFTGQSGAEAKAGAGTRHHLWPAYWGTTADGRGYGGLFPLYGTFLERFGRERITFALWPLYSHSEWEGHHQYSILWPIFQRVTGPRDHGWRLWPLWGDFESRGHMKRRYALWPIFIDEWRDLETDDPVHRRMVFPLVVRDQGPKRSRWIVLWPFFQTYRNGERDFTRWDAPWPFVTRAKGPTYDSWRFWPLFGRTRKPETTSVFVLWPIFSGEWTRDARTGGERREQRWLLLSHLVRDRKGDGTAGASFTRLWPFFTHRRAADGSREFYFPAILPTEEAGLHRVYGPFLKLYESREGPDGAGRSKALWGLYRHTWTRSWHRVAFSFLFNMEWSDDTGDRSWDLLGGLLGRRRREGRESFRLFYLSLPAGGGAPPR